MIGTDAATMKSACEYLVGRGWSASYVTDLYTGVVYVQAKQPTYVIINISHPSKMIMKIPKFIIGAFQLSCVVCSSETGPRAQNQLQKTGMTAMIHGAVSGPSIFLKISDMIKAGQGHLKNQPAADRKGNLSKSDPGSGSGSQGVSASGDSLGGVSVVGSAEGSANGENQYDPNYVKDESKVKPFLDDVNTERHARGLAPVVDPYKDGDGKPFREPPKLENEASTLVVGENGSAAVGAVELSSLNSTKSELDNYAPKDSDLSAAQLLAAAPNGGFVNDIGSGCICRVRSGEYRGFYFVVLGNGVTSDKFNLQRELVLFIRELFVVPEEKSLEHVVFEIIEAPEWSEMPVKGVMTRVSCDRCVLMAFLKSDQVTEVLTVESGHDMIEVSKECLHRLVKLSFNLYLHLKKNKKYVHYVNSGEVVAEKKLQNILENDLPIYVKKTDLHKYKDTHIRALLEKNIKQYKIS